MMIYKLIPVFLPPFKKYSANVSEVIKADSGEDSPFVGASYMVQLPAVVHDDCARLARQLGWTPGQVLGHLVLQGILRLRQENI